MVTDKLQDLQFLICGGDRRERELMRIWRSRGYRVTAVGLEESKLLTPNRVASLPNLSGTDVLILPLQGTDEKGRVSSSSGWIEIRSRLQEVESERLLVLTGPLKTGELFSPGMKIIYTSQDEELVRINAILTAEG